MASTATDPRHRVTDRPTERSIWWVLAAFLVATAVAAGLGGAASSSAGSEYESLELPFFAPPSWLFGPVWSVLYVAIGVAGWLAWRRTGVDVATGWWVGQLVLNAAWTPIFFGAGAYGWALVEIAALLVAISVTIALFRNRSRAAAWLMVPYLGWVAFATALNASIWWLNR